MECQRKRCIQEKEKPLFSKTKSTRLKCYRTFGNWHFCSDVSTKMIYGHCTLSGLSGNRWGCAEPWSQAQNPQNGRPSLQPLGWIKKEKFLLKEDGSYHLCHLSALEVHGEGKIWETTEEKNLSSLINAK